MDIRVLKFVNFLSIPHSSATISRKLHRELSIRSIIFILLLLSGNISCKCLIYQGISSMAPETRSPGDVEPKPRDSFVEVAVDETGEKKAAARDGADYSGAVEKSSPEEIRLVRKLDLRIMPTLWCMYFLNYVRPRSGSGTNCGDRG